MLIKVDLNWKCVRPLIRRPSAEDDVKDPILPTYLPTEILGLHPVAYTLYKNTKAITTNNI